MVSESYQPLNHRQISESQGISQQERRVLLPFFLPAPLGNLASCKLQTFSDLERGRTHPCKHTKQSKKPGVQLEINRCGKAGFSALSIRCHSLLRTAGFPHGIGTSTILVWRDPILAFQANSILSFWQNFDPSLGGIWLKRA